MNQKETLQTIDRHLSCLDHDENNLNLLIEISDLYFELADFESAQKYITRANAIDREACLPHQGMLYLNQGQFKEAKICFKEAFHRTPTPALHYNLGLACYLNNELQEAWDTLSLITDNEYLSARQLLMARILQQKNTIDESAAILEELIKQNPNDAEALGLLSLLHLDTNNEESAKHLSQRALALEPQLYEARLVDLMLKLINQEATLEEIELLLEVNPSDSRLWFALGSTHMTQGNYHLAETHLKKTIDIHPEFYDCHIALGWCQLLNNEIDTAYETYQDAVSLVDTLSDGWGGLALIHALNEDLDTAEQLIEKASSLNSECFLTKIAQVIYFNYKNPERASKELSAGLKQNKPISEKLALIIEQL